jgi:hypothetical protein
VRVRPRLIALSAALVFLAGCARGGTAVSRTLERDTGQPFADRLLFGLGPEADSARGSPLVREAPVRMLTSWFNGSSDLSWMSRWRPTIVLPAYRNGLALHLVVWDGGSEGPLVTPHGSACGRAYALSYRFLQDMRVLARTFAGGPRDNLYVTLFAEFQTYPCRDNAWSPDSQTTDYYKTLKDQYLKALAIFHADAPNARVSLGWGGWQAAYDNPSIGGGRSLFKHFVDVMRVSGFQSFQSLESPAAVRDANRMTHALAPYGPVMLAFYKPAGSTSSIQRAQLSSFLSPGNLARLHRGGLFALSLMDSTFLRDRATLKLVETAVRDSGCTHCVLP